MKAISKKRLEVLAIRAEGMSECSGKNPFSELVKLLARESGQSLSKCGEVIAREMPDFYRKYCG